MKARNITITVSLMTLSANLAWAQTYEGAQRELDEARRTFASKVLELGGRASPDAVARLREQILGPALKNLQKAQDEAAEQARRDSARQFSRDFAPLPPAGKPSVKEPSETEEAKLPQKRGEDEDGREVASEPRQTSQPSGGGSLPPLAPSVPAREEVVLDGSKVERVIEFQKGAKKTPTAAGEAKGWEASGDAAAQEISFGGSSSRKPASK